ncbi:phage major capsid protein [Nocardioides ochotonae]|uniref:phage major capsid protein n=1 Tax=Nocardioides ochotonae TaxID=2685869 RepID=UPI0014073FEF|nr:phage major capsid protein [Nocardioides ochotonae]
MIAHPNVVAEVRKSKATTAGTYVLDPTTAGPSSILGVPVISTPAATAAVVWVVEPTGVTIFRRGPLVVDLGTTGDNWSHNIQSIRAEERVGTAVTRPSSLTKLTLSGGSRSTAKQETWPGPGLSSHVSPWAGPLGPEGFQGLPSAHPSRDAAACVPGRPASEPPVPRP